MCFYADSDWVARQVEESSRTTQPGENLHCHECQRDITAGCTLHEIEMHEYDECQVCYDGECKCPDGDCCRCEQPQYGEDCHWQVCNDCFRFLEAVQYVEEDAGCSGPETRPLLFRMQEAICDRGLAEAKPYWQRARKLYPDLASSGYLGWLWREVFA